jgi:two-component system alkaline phosphatase synthesis response regulator PhoP
MTRILLVEDEPSLAAGVRDDLQAEGYTVDLVVDGQAAAARGAQGQYDLILLDVMLPKKDGFAVCRELRAGNIHTPIIMLTARAQEIDKVLGWSSEPTTTSPNRSAGASCTRG